MHHLDYWRGLGVHRQLGLVFTDCLDLGGSKLASGDLVHKEPVELGSRSILGLWQAIVRPDGQDEAASGPEEPSFPSPCVCQLKVKVDEISAAVTYSSRQ